MVEIIGKWTFEELQKLCMMVQQSFCTNAQVKLQKDPFNTKVHHQHVSNIVLKSILKFLFDEVCVCFKVVLILKLWMKWEMI